MSALYKVVMDKILPDIIKTDELGRKLSTKLFEDMINFCSDKNYSELHTEIVKYTSTILIPGDYSGMDNKFENYIQSTISSLGKIIMECSVFPKYSIYWPGYCDKNFFSLMKDVCKAFLEMKSSILSYNLPEEYTYYPERDKEMEYMCENITDIFDPSILETSELLQKYLQKYLLLSIGRLTSEQTREEYVDEIENLTTEFDKRISPEILERLRDPTHPFVDAFLELTLDQLFIIFNTC